MKKAIRRAALALALCLVLGLAACSNPIANDITTLVKGNLDEVYLGEFDPDYLKLVDSTEAQSQKDYEEGMEVSAEVFAYYWNITDDVIGYEDLDQSLRDEIVSLCKEIYSKSKYEVQPAEKSGDGSYSVKVLVEPIDVIQRASDLFDSGSYAPLNQLQEKYANISNEEIDEDFYSTFTHEYGEVIVQLVREQLSELGYLEQKSQVIQVTQDSNDVWNINEDNWYNFDSYVISYP